MQDRNSRGIWGSRGFILIWNQNLMNSASSRFPDVKLSAGSSANKALRLLWDEFVTWNPQKMPCQKRQSFECSTIYSLYIIYIFSFIITTLDCSISVCSDLESSDIRSFRFSSVKLRFDWPTQLIVFARLSSVCDVCTRRYSTISFGNCYLGCKSVWDVYILY